MASILLALALGGYGCASTGQPTGDRLDEPTSNWNRDYRGASEDGLRAGVTAKARQIEKNLGIE